MIWPLVSAREAEAMGWFSEDWSLEEFVLVFLQSSDDQAKLSAINYWGVSCLDLLLGFG